MEQNEVRLTQFSPGAGCGCKMSPKDLAAILHIQTKQVQDVHLLVGYETKDDAAVYEIGNGQCIISTTDFFTPIVDDPYYFGRIAASNAMSDVYAMGGTPLMAISILGWPLEKLGIDTAGRVIAGAIDACREAGIALAGGHSIDISDPIFGLAVTGMVEKEYIRRNDSAEAGCSIFLTKPLGIGIISTAMKKNMANPAHTELAIRQMAELNKPGALLGKQPYVKAMTDVTGFGLLGHLLEMCEGSGLAATLDYSSIPLIPGVYDYIERQCIPGGTSRNWKSYGDKVGKISDEQRCILCDPQTSGGLLLAVDSDGVDAFREFCSKQPIRIFEIGKFKVFEEGKEWIEIL
jgi:selenide, water dikinase